MRRDVQQIKINVAPSIFYFRELGLKPRAVDDGWVSGGLCPFHEDQREGSFRVNLSSGSFICFACHAKGGDIIAFAALRHGMKFDVALIYVAKVGGLL